MLSLRLCLGLSVLLAADSEGSDTVYHDTTPQVDSDDRRKSSAECRDDADDPSDWLGTHLLQRDLSLHRGLAPNVRVNSETQPAWTRGKMEKPLGTKDMGGWFKTIYTPEQQMRLKVDEEGNPHQEDAGSTDREFMEFMIDQHMTVGLVWVFLVVGTVMGIKSRRGKLCGRRSKSQGQPLQSQGDEEQPSAGEAIAPNSGEANVQSAESDTPEADPEWTGGSNEDEHVTAEELVVDDDIIIKPEFNAADYGFSFHGVRFVLPPQSPASLGSGQWSATGMSGKEFIQAAISGFPENGSMTLVVSLYSSNGNFAQKWKFTKSPLTGMIPIFDSCGELYGSLEPVPDGGRCLVKHEGMVAMSLDIDDHAELQVTAYSSAGHPFASSFKDGTKDPEGGEIWKVQAKPGTDAIFVSSCMLAHMLLNHGGRTCIPAFAQGV